MYSKLVCLQVNIAMCTVKQLQDCEIKIDGYSLATTPERGTTFATTWRNKCDNSNEIHTLQPTTRALLPHGSFITLLMR